MKKLLLYLAAVIVVSVSSTYGATGRKVSGNLVFWDQANGFQTIQNNPDIFSSVSPFWYTIDNAGQVVPYRTAAGASYEDAGIVTFLRANNIQIMPTVADINNGVWNGALVSQIINDPAKSQANINSLVNLAVSKGYDGIDLDYEDLPASDRNAFSLFVQNLATALHTQGKLLSVNVYAKTSEPGDWSGPQSQDYAALGQTADELRLMVYEYHWATSPPGPVSPVYWVNDVLAFAVSKIPAQKIIHGLPAYGYDWVNNAGADKVWQDSMALANAYGANINWDSASATPWFSYTASGAQHTVWFENAAASDAKLALTNQYNVGGVNFWRLGREDPSTWSYVRARFGSLPPANLPPTVSITDPANNSVFNAPADITISANAADSDDAVSRVDFYTGATLLGTAAGTPYSVVWRNVSAGSYNITATATDSRGATSSASVAFRVNSPTVVTTVRVTPANVSLLTGGTVQFVARVYDQYGQEITGRTLSWQTSNAGVMTVNANGLGYAVGRGRATIKATVGTVTSDNIYVRVTR